MLAILLLSLPLTAFTLPSLQENASFEGLYSAYTFTVITNVYSPARFRTCHFFHTQNSVLSLFLYHTHNKNVARQQNY